MADTLNDTDRKALKEFEAELDAEYEKQLDALAKVFEKKGPPTEGDE